MAILLQRMSWLLQEAVPASFLGEIDDVAGHTILELDLSHYTQFRECDDLGNDVKQRGSNFNLYK